MSKKCKTVQRSMKNSPVLFEDEEIGTSSSDEVKARKSTAMSQSKLHMGHSTPIHNKYKIDTSDSPDLNYNESPIEPLTQHPQNEVGWDYQRLIKEEDEDKAPVSMDISKTPKRSIFLTKKRNSNSPLLYKPLKKKLIQEEQQENMEGFMAELKAIEIKAKQIGEKTVEVPQKCENEVESQLIVELDSQPSDESDIKLQVSANTDESSGQSKGGTTDKKYVALLDDSIEDIMVLCSQEVEAKEFGSKRTPQTKPTLINNSRELVTSKISPNYTSEKHLNNLSKENVQPFHDNGKVVSDTSSKNSSTSKAESGSLEFPDDSFDDIFVEIDDKDFCKNANTEILIDSVNKTVKSYSKSSIKLVSSTITSDLSKNCKIQNKFFQSKTLAHAAQTKSTSNTSHNNDVNHSQASNVAIQTKVVNATANFGYLNKEYTKYNSSGFYSQTETQSNSSSIGKNNDARYSSSIGKNNDARIFKAKSFSDSNFLHQSNTVNNFDNKHRSVSNLNIGLMNQQMQRNQNSVNNNSSSTYYASGSSEESKNWRRVHSSSSISGTGRSNNEEFTPEEIERKKQEAIMKREAKLKMQFTNMTLKRPIQYPVKR